MIDTANLMLSCDTGSARGNFMKEITPHLSGDVRERVFNSNPVLIGRLDNLNVVVSASYVRVGDGSLCKYYLGDNLKVMRRQDVQNCFEKISDTLHVSFSGARVTRLDWAENFVMEKPITEYLNHFGTPARGLRDRYSETCLYYHGMNGKTFCFYDKKAEMKSEVINPIWQGKNVLRLEQRYTKHLARCLMIEDVTAKVLYEQDTYAKLTKMWANDILSIPLVNDFNLDITKMKNKKDLYKMGVLCLCEKYGGQNALLALIKKEQEEGELTNKQAFDLKQAINEANNIENGFVEANEAMLELQSKIKEVALHSR